LKGLAAENEGMAHYIHEDGLKLRQKVRAVVTNTAGEVLLIRPHGYAPDQWTLAGGGVEAGESPVEAMRRELAEELGLECENLEQLPVQNRFVYSRDYKLKRGLDHDGQQAVMFFLRVPLDIELRIQAEEIAEARWFEPEEAAGAFPVAKQRTVFQECMVLAA
jgi:8-oxo-dGTP pyrophosphatase MutT (NUDIX family)